MSSEERPPSSHLPPRPESLISENPVLNSISTASDISRSSSSTSSQEWKSRAMKRLAAMDSEEKEKFSDIPRKIYQFKRDVMSLSVPNAVLETPYQHENAYKEKNFEYEKESQMDSKRCNKCSGFRCEKFDDLIFDVGRAKGRDKNWKKNRRGGFEDLGDADELQRKDSVRLGNGDDEKAPKMNMGGEWEMIEAHTGASLSESSDNERENAGISIVDQVSSCDEDQREDILDSNERSGVNHIESYPATRSPRWKKTEHRAGITSFTKEDRGNSFNDNQRGFGSRVHASIDSTFLRSRRFRDQDSPSSQKTHGSNLIPFSTYQPYSILPNALPPKCTCQFHQTPLETRLTPRHTIYGYDLPLYTLPQTYILILPTKSLIVDHNCNVWYLFSSILPSHPIPSILNLYHQQSSPRAHTSL